MAIDLRFLLAVLKINSNLERIGDIADGIAKYVIKADDAHHKNCWETSRILLNV